MPRLGTPVGAWAAALAALEAPAARPQHHDIVADAAQLPIRRVAVPGPRRAFKKSGRCPLPRGTTQRGPFRRGSGEEPWLRERGVTNKALKAIADGTEILTS